MKLHPILIVCGALLSTCLLNAAPRIWTSTDGKTIEGTLVGKTETSATVRREPDKKDVVIPLERLSEADREFVAKTNIRDLAAEVTKLIDEMPNAPMLRGREVTAELRDLHAKYLSDVKFYRPNTLAANLKATRSKIESDIKRLTPIAQTDAADTGPKGKRQGIQSAAAENSILSAREALKWLQGPFNIHLAKFDKLLEQ